MDDWTKFWIILGIVIIILTILTWIIVGVCDC